MHRTMPDCSRYGSIGESDDRWRCIYTIKYLYMFLRSPFKGAEWSPGPVLLHGTRPMAPSSVTSSHTIPAKQMNDT